jgi:hypothetical protein
MDCKQNIQIVLDDILRTGEVLPRSGDSGDMASGHRK